MSDPAAAVSIASLHRMKRTGTKIVAVVAWDCHMARIAERAGADIVSVGDTVGVNLWGHRSPLEVTMDEMIIVARAARRGAERALVSADVPFGPLQEGSDAAVRAAVRLVKEAGVDMVKLDGAADYPEAVEAVTRAGIPVWAQLGITPQTALRHGVAYGGSPSHAVAVATSLRDELVAEARRLDAAGAALLDFTNSGPEAGPAVVGAVSIPVLGGVGGGPWLDGRVRMANAAVGYASSGVDEPPDSYANVARTVFDALRAYADDVRSGRQIRGGIPVAARG